MGFVQIFKVSFHFLKLMICICVICTCVYILYMYIYLYIWCLIWIYIYKKVWLSFSSFFLLPFGLLPLRTSLLHKTVLFPFQLLYMDSVSNRKRAIGFTIDFSVALLECAHQINAIGKPLAWGLIPLAWVYKETMKERFLVSISHLLNFKIDYNYWFLLYVVSVEFELF